MKFIFQAITLRWMFTASCISELLTVQIQRLAHPAKLSTFVSAKSGIVFLATTFCPTTGVFIN